MWGSTVDNRQALVFYSHPITVKGVFLARKSPKSTMTASRRNKISLAFLVLSHVRRTKVWESWSWANSQSLLKKDKAVLTQTGSIWQSHGDHRWPSGLRFEPQLLAGTFLQTLTKKGPMQKKLWRSTCIVTLRSQVQMEKYTRLRLATIHTATKCREREREKKKLLILFTFSVRPSAAEGILFLPPHKEIWHIHTSSRSKPNTSLNSGPDATFGLPIPAVVFPPPVTVRWFSGPARLHQGTMGTGPCSLPAQIDRQEGEGLEAHKTLCDPPMRLIK